MRVFLETDRMTLRRFTGTDVVDLVQLDSDPDVMRYLTGGRATPREVIEQETLPRILRLYQRGAGLGFWAAVEKANDAFLGWFELREISTDSALVVELGYRLRRQAWGRGLATEGAHALVHKAFTELGVHQVVAETMVVNTASRRVLEKAGLMLVEICHRTFDDPIEGSEHGEARYAVDRTAWRHHQVNGAAPSTPAHHDPPDQSGHGAR